MAEPTPAQPSAGAAEPAVRHDFGRVPIFGPGLPGAEKSVTMPGEEEQTVDGGGVATPSSSFCDCQPTSLAIQNVKPYRNGKLYGHSFDVAINLNYTDVPAPAAVDAEFAWFEKTDRAPAWQGLRPNAWNDMFALFPGSPTFDGWTKNRTRPCPGSETATITDPPAASVDLPPRTLEFDLYVWGTKSRTFNAKAKQVLEPDGAGGVKTQTFTVLPASPGPVPRPR